MADEEESSVRPLMMGTAEEGGQQERPKGTDSESSWQHLTKRGHTGKVLSVASSDDADYVVSGGEDYTMRVWYYDPNMTRSFDLIAVLLHDQERAEDLKNSSSDPEAPGKSPWLCCSTKMEAEGEARGVTAVACAGQRGPVISGTSSGNVYVLFLGFGEGEGMCMPEVGLHEDRITEICVPFGLGELDEDSDWALGVASRDGNGSLLHFHGSDYEVHALPHGREPVLGIRHLEGGGEDDASFATHTREAVHLWNLKGEQVAMLQDFFCANGGDAPELRDIAVANKETGTLLFVGNQESLAVWGFEKGKIVGPYGESPPPEPYDKYPIVVYKEDGRSMEIDQSRQTTEFFVSLHDDYTCGVWNLKGVEKGNLAIEPRGPANLLASPKKMHQLLDLRHSSRVMQIRVAEDGDDAGGPCLIAACSDGSIKVWDLEGVDKGEVYAELRSLSWVEIIMPLGLLSVSFLQVISFAFGPSIDWRDEVKRPAHITQRFAFCDIYLELAIPRNLLFLAKIYLALGMVSLFLVFAMTGTPQLLNNCIYKIQSQYLYKHEGRRATFGPMHVVRRVVQLMRSGVVLQMWLCSTVAVAPVFRVLAQAVHCVENHKTKKWQLGVAPEISCMEGPQPKLARAVYVLSFTYFLVLIPHSIVEGDADYMKWKKLFFPLSHWGLSAQRKATVKSLGPLHPNPKYVFRTLFIDLAAKALLPVIETLWTTDELTLMLLCTAVAVTSYISALCFPPKTGRMFCCFLQDTRLFTLCAMLCGCLTVVMDKDKKKSEGDGSAVPMLVLGACLVLVPLHTLHTALRSPLSAPVVQSCSTAEVTAGDDKTTYSEGLDQHDNSPAGPKRYANRKFFGNNKSSSDTKVGRFRGVLRKLQVRLI